MKKAADLHLKTVKAWARLDFPAAMRETETLPVPERLRYLRAIIDSLTP